MTMRAWMIVRLALGGLRRTRLRVALTSLGVAIGCGALVSMLGFALGFQAQAEAPFEQLDLLNTIEVKPKRAGDYKNWRGPHGHGASEDVDLAREEEDGPPLNDEAIGRMAALDGVALAYPDLRTVGLKVAYRGKEVRATAMGVPRQMPLSGSMETMIIAGEFFSLGSQPEAIFSTSLAKQLGFDPPTSAIGSIVTLRASGLSHKEGTEFDLEKREFSVRVVGVYAIPYPVPRLARRSILVLPVEFMKDIPGIRLDSVLESVRTGGSEAEAGYRRCTVRLKDPSHLASVEEQIQAMGFRTYAMLNRLERMRAFFVFVDVLLAAVGTVALVVAGLGIVNTLVMSVLERYQEIGIYKAIGASDGDLLVLFLAEAGILGLLGGLGGLLLGRVVSWILEIAVNAYAQSQGVTIHVDIFAFPGWLMVGAVAFSVVVSVLAGVYPAMRAARVDPIQALRGG